MSNLLDNFLTWMAGLLIFLMVLLLLGLGVFGIISVTRPPHNTTVIGVVTDKGWTVKPLTYWIDIDNTEINSDEQIWNAVKPGEKIRLILSNGFAENVQYLGGTK